jgi:hypothetical protein
VKNPQTELESDDVVLSRKFEAIEAGFTEYYDSATEDQLKDEQDWAQLLGPNILVEVEP